MARPPRALHVLPSEDGWSVKREGAGRAASTHETKQEAVKAARKQAEGEGGQLKIHKLDGKIQEERTYRKDPSPPAG